MLREEINPYSSRVFEYPNRIFPFEDFSSDRKKIRELSEGRDVYVELGSGAGNHLVSLATRMPSAQCFGFELRYKRLVRTIEKAIKAGADNVYVARYDGRSVDKIFSPASIKGVYVNFPDPWERYRRRKHRILTSDFLTNIRKLLSEDGFISVKTDHQEYFQSFMSAVDESDAFSVVESSCDLYHSEYLESNIKTEFEGIFSTQGLPIFYAKVMESCYG